ncbi:MAG: hypothetical protein ACREPB_14515 [Arenimonas sp.]
MTAIWLSISVWLNTPCFWMSIFAVIDIALMLHFTGVKPGWPRFLGVFLSACIITAASQWFIAANAFGLALGLWPVEAARQIGPVLVWEFTRLRLDSMTLIYLPASFFLAVLMGLRLPK